ncbi:hypothetical protein V1525DRAFT_366091 [Lipomyces kononenkoae]|uniref:Uncharacterized protein n=1 Tax=Lipomyces kononenkoae TaxID=34357 RepID=A0ACC3SU29_LIPKO
MSSTGLDVDVGNFDENGNPEPYYMGRMYWVVMGSCLGFAFVLRAGDYSVSWVRIRSRSSTPSRSAPSWLYTEFVSLVRSLTYPTPLILQRYPNYFSMPSIGRAFLAILYIGFILALCFYKLPLKTGEDWENAGFRTGWLTLAQLPMVVNLASRRLNIIAFLTGESSYVPVNFFHRWVARGIFVTACLHFLFMNMVPKDLQTLLPEYNTLKSNGVGSWFVLAWLALFSSFRPIRHFFYEVFIVNHMVSAIVLFIILLFHTRDYTQLKSYVYILVSLAMFLADFVVRWSIILFYNISLSNSQAGVCRFTATVHVMPDQETLVIEVPTTTADRGIRRYKWRAGQHVSISFPTVAPFASHPFTVSSLSKDGKVLLVVRVKTGFTRKLLQKTLATGEQIQKEQPIGQRRTASIAVATSSFPVLIDLPHGGPTRDWKEFQTVLAVVSGVGATFGFSMIRDVLRHPYASQVKMIWIVKRYEDIAHFEEQLQAVIDERGGSVSTPQQDVAMDAAKLQNEASDYQATTRETSLQIDIFVADCATEPPTVSSLSEFLSANSDVVRLVAGKPGDLRGDIERVLESASGETGIAVCGSTSLCAQVKNIVAALLIGSRTNGCYVHSEQFQA